MLSNIWKPLAIISLVALSLWGLSTWRYAAGYAAGKRLAEQAWQLKWETRNRDEETAGQTGSGASGLKSNVAGRP
ncbi:hypothetical protein O0544_20570 [Edwardsiella anguillarum]|nr:hypothetical protein [Edwardsiella anguillarum]